MQLRPRPRLARGLGGGADTLRSLGGVAAAPAGPSVGWNVPAAVYFVLGMGEGGAGQGSRGPGSWRAASFPFPGSLWGEGRRRTCLVPRLGSCGATREPLDSIASFATD